MEVVLCGSNVTSVVDVEAHHWCGLWELLHLEFWRWESGFDQPYFFTASQVGEEGHLEVRKYVLPASLIQLGKVINGVENVCSVWAGLLLLCVLSCCCAVGREAGCVACRAHLWVALYQSCVLLSCWQVGILVWASDCSQWYWSEKHLLDL